MVASIGDLPDDVLRAIMGSVIEANRVQARRDGWVSKSNIQLWMELSLVCHRWQALMETQPVCLDGLDAQVFSRACRWAGAAGCRPPVTSISMEWGRLPWVPRPWHKRRVQLTRLLRSRHFQRRSAGSLISLWSVAGADMAGVETVYTKLAGLTLAGPLPPAPLPPSVWKLSISGSEVTADADEELRLLCQEQDQPGLPPLGNALQDLQNLHELMLRHYHLEDLEQLPPSTWKVKMVGCTMGGASHPVYVHESLPGWDVRLDCECDYYAPQTVMGRHTVEAATFYGEDDDFMSAGHVRSRAFFVAQ